MIYQQYLLKWVAHFRGAESIITTMTYESIT